MSVSCGVADGKSEGLESARPGRARDSGTNWLRSSGVDLTPLNLSL